MRPRINQGIDGRRRRDRAMDRLLVISARRRHFSRSVGLPRGGGRPPAAGCADVGIYDRDDGAQVQRGGRRRRGQVRLCDGHPSRVGRTRVAACGRVWPRVVACGCVWPRVAAHGARPGFVTPMFAIWLGCDMGC